MNIPASWLPCTVPLYCKWNRKHLIMMSGKRDLLATLRSKSIDIGSFHGRSRDDELGSNNNLKSGSELNRDVPNNTQRPNANALKIGELTTAHISKF